MKTFAFLLVALAYSTQALAAAAKDKTGMDAINATGCDVEILAPAQTVERIKTDAAKWGRVIREVNIKAD